MFDHKVVVKLTDGSVIKGFGELFFPTEKSFELMNLENKMSSIDLEKVFAVFFVKDFDGNPNRDRTRVTGVIRSYSHGKPVEVTLANGEKIRGKTLGERGNADLGMFLHPIDPADNNQNIYFPFTSIGKIESIPDPEKSGVKKPLHPALRR